MRYLLYYLFASLCLPSKDGSGETWLTWMGRKQVVSMSPWTPLALHPHSHSQSINPICASFGSASVLRHQPSSQLPLHHIQVFVQIHTSMPSNISSPHWNATFTDLNAGFPTVSYSISHHLTLRLLWWPSTAKRHVPGALFMGLFEALESLLQDTQVMIPLRRVCGFLRGVLWCSLVRPANVFDPMVRSKQTAQFIFSSELKSIKRQPTPFLTLKVPVFCLLPSYPPVVFPTPPTLRKYLGLWVQSEPLGASLKETWSKLEPAKSKMHRQGRRRDKQSTKIRMIWDGMNRRYNM